MGLEALLLRLSGTWVFEITAALFSASCFAGLLVTLYLSNGQIVETWNGITLNTIVSVLATASRLSALFIISTAIGQTKWNLFQKGPRSLLDFEAIDHASRGVLGCAELLWRTRSIATLGAIAFVLAMAFEPFAQQLIQYEADVLYPSTPDGNVSLPFARRYDAGTAVEMQQTTIEYDWLQEYVYGADFAMQAAVLNGLTQSTSLLTQQLPLACPSGNCTWPLVESLAVCSACNNVTSALQSSVDVAPILPYLVEANLGLWSANATRFELPNGLWINNEDDGVPDVRMVAFGTGDPEKTITFGDMETLIWSMSMISADLVGANDTAQWPHGALVGASECALYYCVKTYNTTVANSKVEQNVLHSYTRRSPDSWQAWNAGSAAEEIGQKNLSSLEEAALFSGSLQHTDLMLGDGFNLSQAAVMGISSYLRSTFNRDRTVGSSDFKAILTGYYLHNYGRPTPAAMQPLYENRHDFSFVFNSIAESMSNVIRSSGGKQSGFGGRNVTRYRVQWPWIALPAIVVIASLLQLITTMFSSRRRPLWKSSALATLSRGPFVADVFGNAGTIVGLTHAAEKRKVDLFYKKGAHKDETSLLSSGDGSM